MPVPALLIDWPNAETAVPGLSRPDRLNALTHDMLDELSAGLAKAAASRQARAVILTEAGRAFVEVQLIEDVRADHGERALGEVQDVEPR
jgi:enoyl-CoA hydratase/carnithine racemase